ncbi:MAG: DUF3347 domain-containing protein [Opitutales bacterium]|nr:DUF3347 domain-containing protein [Opitutales bacterium]MCH8541081.1 DUF3347 domain-containing protein [Opitutales bacterium]
MQLFKMRKILITGSFVFLGLASLAFYSVAQAGHHKGASAEEGKEHGKSSHHHSMMEHPEGKQAHREVIWGHYLSLQEALASDDLDKAKEIVETWSESGHKRMLKPLTEGDDLESLRKAFKKVSRHFIKMAEKGHTPEDLAVGVAHCPMAFDNEGASWVQRKGDIANPYYGASMLRCGDFKDMSDNKEEKKDSKHDH